MRKPRIAVILDENTSGDGQRYEAAKGYFRVADNEAELQHLAKAELRAIPSIWGHRAGNPSTNAEDAAFLKAAVREWMER